MGKKRNEHAEKSSQVGEVRVHLLHDWVPDVPDAVIGQQMFRLPWLAYPSTLAATHKPTPLSSNGIGWNLPSLVFFSSRCSDFDVEEVCLGAPTGARSVETVNESPLAPAFSK